MCLAVWTYTEDLLVRRYKTIAPVEHAIVVFRCTHCTLSYTSPCEVCIYLQQLRLQFDGRQSKHRRRANTDTRASTMIKWCSEHLDRHAYTTACSRWRQHLFSIQTYVQWKFAYTRKNITLLTLVQMGVGEHYMLCHVGLDVLVHVACISNPWSSQRALRP